MKRCRVLLSFLLLVASAAHAEPGIDDEVYGATIESGKTELETRFARLTAGAAGGEDALVLEGAHGFSPGFYGATIVTFSRGPGSRRRLQTFGLEGIFALGRIDSLNLHTALYVEAEHDLHGRNSLETKLLLEHRKGPFDTRLNLIAERVLTSHAPVELGYAASADYEVADDLRLGAEAFGDLGTSDMITTRTEHFVGPAVKVELDRAGSGEFELRAGYLFAVGRAREETKGQLRFGLEYEF